MGSYFKKVGIVTAIGMFALAAVFIVVGLTSSLLRFGFLLTGGILVLAGFFCLFIGKFTGGLAGDEKLLQTGVPGTAVVMSLAETGMVINYTNQVLNIGLRVQVGGGAPYDVMVRQTVPMIMMSRVTPGATIGVKVDPADQSRVVIDWSMVPGVNPVAGYPQAQAYPQAPGYPAQPGAPTQPGYPQA